MGEPDIVAGNVTNNINQTTYENNFDQSLNTTDDVQFNNVTITGWFTGLFNLAVSSLSNFLSISNNGTTIEINFNESYLNESIGSYVSNITGGGVGTDTNASTACSGDEVLLGNGSCMSIDSFESTYNTTYDLWAYNMTLDSLFDYNMTDGYSPTTYNATYDLWAYNQSSTTQGGIWSNVSGVATYDGDANITGNLTVDSKIDFSESDIYITVNSTTFGRWI